MRERAGVEIKVGLVSLIGIIILTLLIFSIGDYNLFQRRKEVNLLFSFAGGVEGSAPVRLAGVKVGEVRSINLYNGSAGDETHVRVKVWLDRKVTLYENADVYVNTLGLLGEKYIEILNPGTADHPAVGHGGTLHGQDPVPFERITQSTHKIVDQLERLISGLNDVVGDEGFRYSLKNAVAHFEATGANLREVTAKVRAGEGTLGSFIHNDSLYNELEGFAKEIRQHPWKLLKRDKSDKSEREKNTRTGASSKKGFINH